MENKKISKVFPPNEEHILDFLAKEDIVDQLENFIEQIKDKYLEEQCDDSFEFIQHDSIWNLISRVVENIAIDNQ
tara:strand:- start:108 stop:332 length:225 start_codon:yes stop_codon:yes gene_type:complete